MCACPRVCIWDACVLVRGCVNRARLNVQLYHSVCGRQEGADRRPPNKYPMIIYTAASGVVVVVVVWCFGVSCCCCCFCCWWWCRSCCWVDVVGASTHTHAPSPPTHMRTRTHTCAHSHMRTHATLTTHIHTLTPTPHLRTHASPYRISAADEGSLTLHPRSPSVQQSKVHKLDWCPGLLAIEVCVNIVCVCWCVCVRLFAACVSLWVCCL